MATNLARYVPPARGFVTTLERAAALDGIADGLEGGVRPHSFGWVEELVPELVVASEDSIARALAGLAIHQGLVAEGAGATAVAALLDPDLRERWKGRRTCVIVSGRNVEPALLARLVATPDESAS